jgi:phage terminase large subunit-like protein
VAGVATTLADERAIREGCYYDPRVWADRIHQFFADHLTLSRGRQAHKPFIELPYQRAFTDDVFGWVKPDGSPRYSTALLTTAKKAGKSSFIAGVALTRLVLTDEPRPFVCIGAYSRKNASEMFEDIASFIRASPRLSQALVLKNAEKTILYPARNGRITVISSEAPSSGGFDCSTVILDEISLHRNSKLHDFMLYSTRAREAPLMILLSNAGWDRTHFYWSIYSKAKNILAGTDDDPSFCGHVWEVPEDAPWDDTSLLPLANPGLGTVITLDRLVEDLERAKKNKAEEGIYRRWTLNQWTTTSTNYVDLAEYDQCRGNFPDLSNTPVYVAVDLSATTDLTGVVACYPVDGKVYVRCWAFVPSASLEKQAQNAQHYQAFAQEKALTILPGNAMDYEAVRNCIKKIPGRIKHVAFDKWNSMETSHLLAKDGFDVMNFPQTATFYNEPMRKLASLILDRKLVHDGNPCLRWAINNLQAKTDDKGRLYPMKGSAHLKIDPVIALLMALNGCLTHSDLPPAPKPYEARGLFVL